MAKMRDYIPEILGSDKLVTITYKEFNAMASDFERRKELVEDREKKVTARETEVNEYHKGLVCVMSGERYCADNIEFISESDAIKLLKEKMEQDLEKRFEDLKKYMIQSVEITKFK